MRDRVGAVDIVFVSSSNEMGAFESGVIAKYLGPSLPSSPAASAASSPSSQSWPSDPMLHLSVLTSAKPGEVMN